MKNIKILKFSELSPEVQVKVVSHNDYQVYATVKAALNRLTDSINKFAENLIGIKNFFDYKVISDTAIEFFFNPDELLHREVLSKLPPDGTEDMANFLNDETRKYFIENKPVFNPIILQSIRKFKQLDTPLIYLFFQIFCNKLNLNATIFYYDATHNARFFSDWILGKRVVPMFVSENIYLPRFITEKNYTEEGKEIDINSLP